MKEKLGRIYKEGNKSIRNDHNNHRYEIISRNIENFRSAKKAYKELTTFKSWIQKLEQNSQDANSRRDVISHATKFYKNLYTKQNNTEMETQATHKNTSDSIKPIEDFEVYEYVNKLKAEKSPEPDGICNEALKLERPS
ncbi:unnamed protein product [Parnassius apollo]|uniref:(apollo) hypothetical protein n=1 Tax=Parnassius apollo TaxID=110799 RepID=A0A8S3XPH3_PARAO|nr:unnamed protein product [Parnassius apollo]